MVGKHPSHECAKAGTVNGLSSAPFYKKYRLPQISYECWLLNPPSGRDSDVDTVMRLTLLLYRIQDSAFGVTFVQEAIVARSFTEPYIAKVIGMLNDDFKTSGLDCGILSGIYDLLIGTIVCDEVRQAYQNAGQPLYSSTLSACKRIMCQESPPSEDAWALIQKALTLTL